MRSQKVREIIKNLSIKYNISIQEIEKIVSSPFKLQVKVMREGDRDTQDFKSVRIKNFGIFYSPDWLKEIWIRVNKQRKEKEDANIRISELSGDIQS